MNSTELEKIITINGECRLLVKGGSMHPFLTSGRDYVTVRPVDRISRGDIVFYRGPFGRPVMHRVLDIKNGILTLRGDGNAANDIPVPVDRVFGRVTAVVKNGAEYDESSLVFGFYRTLALSRVYRAEKRAVGKFSVYLRNAGTI